jgi:hypothetical protein
VAAVAEVPIEDLTLRGKVLMEYGPSSFERKSCDSSQESLLLKASQPSWLGLPSSLPIRRLLDEPSILPYVTSWCGLDPPARITCPGGMVRMPSHHHESGARGVAAHPGGDTQW